MGEGQAIQQMVLEQMDIKGKKTWNLEPHISHKINSKWITDLNVKYKTTQLTEIKEMIGNLWDLDLGKALLHLTPKA